MSKQYWSNQNQEIIEHVIEGFSRMCKIIKCVSYRSGNFSTKVADTLLKW